MKILIITGQSGAGKTQVVQAMEDMGFYCVDNMPPELIPKFAEIFHRSAGPQDYGALVCDIRGGDFFQALRGSLQQLSESGYEYEILYLDAAEEVLIQRYKETRRSHPLANNGRIIDGIRQEKKLLSALRKQASYIIDTSTMTAAQLKDHVRTIFAEGKTVDGMIVHIVSFGFKYGIPLDADLVFDVRFLPNPFYKKELRDHTGLETCVRDYVMEFPESEQFLEKLSDMMLYLIPQYVKEGKSQLVIGIGCTGGHHRSVTMAEALQKRIKQTKQPVVMLHRDIQKGV